MVEEVLRVLRLADLELDHLTVVYPGDRSYRLDDRVTAMPASLLATPDAAVAALNGG